MAPCHACNCRRATRAGHSGWAWSGWPWCSLTSQTSGVTPALCARRSRPASAYARHDGSLKATAALHPHPFFVPPILAARCRCRLFWSEDQRFLKQFKAGSLGARFKPFSKFPPCYKVPAGRQLHPLNPQRRPAAAACTKQPHPDSFSARPASSSLQQSTCAHPGISAPHVSHQTCPVHRCPGRQLLDQRGLHGEQPVRGRARHRRRVQLHQSGAGAPNSASLATFSTQHQLIHTLSTTTH